MHTYLKINEELSLQHPSEAHIKSLIASINDPLVAANTLTIPYPYAEEDGIEFIQLANERKKDAGYNTNYFIVKEGEVIGGIGLVCQDGYTSHRTEIGYWISAKLRNKGLATSVLKFYVQHLFDHLHFLRLEAHTFCENVASQKVLEKNGFVKEGLLRKYVKKEDKLKDVYYFSKLHPSL